MMGMCQVPETPIRKTYRVYDILSALQPDQVPELKIQIGYDLIATHEEVLDLWLRQSEWKYSQSDGQHYMLDTDPPTEIAGGYIFAEWQLYIARNGENLKRKLDALFAEYDPISNYDMYEQGADGKKQDKHRTKPSGKIQTTSEQYQAGIDSLTEQGALTSKTQNTTAYLENANTETEYDNTKTIRNNDGETETGYHEATDHYLRRYGNVGVTTSAQMISGELSLRTVDLISDFVHRFFDAYCYYVG